MGEKTVRCKFQVQEVARTLYDGAKLTARPVYSQDPNSENKAFWDATPSGELDLSCVKEDAIAHLQPGDEIYIDITKAPAPAEV